jgi:hypothetical protein
MTDDEVRWKAADLVLPDRGAAEAALRAAGADPDPALALTGTLGAYGPVDRVIGLVTRLPDRGPVRDRIGPLLELPANRAVAARLERGELHHLPANRWVAVQLAFELVAERVHLPFTFRPLNADLAQRIEKLYGGRSKLRAYFNHGVQFEGDEVVARRVFSLPVRGSSQDTERDPYVDTVLDDELGLVVEAFARPG